LQAAEEPEEQRDGRSGSASNYTSVAAFYTWEKRPFPAV